MFNNDRPRPKKSLGQNFLISQRVVADIIETAKLAVSPPRGGATTREIVLEVGPGEGILTKALLDAGAKVIAVEKDERLISELEQKFAKEIAGGDLFLVHGDILNFDIGHFIRNQRLGIRNYKLVANIPYYITGELLRKFLSAKHQPSDMVLMLQKEVAERIVTKDGRESLLSLSVKAYGTPEYVRTVKKVCFRPMPSVDSALLAIRNISRNFFSDIDEEEFFKIVKQGFAHKRKLLGNNIPDLPDEHKKWRAEELTLGNWRNLLRKQN